MWKVLVVEDEPFVRRSLIRQTDWESMGFEVVAEAEDGQDALEMISVHRPDLVLADIVMPRMDGLELLKRAKASGYEGLFVMLTCMNEFEYARQALEYGASGYLLKLSVNRQSLKEMLDKTGRELERRLRQQSLADLQKRVSEAWQVYIGRKPYGARADAKTDASRDNKRDTARDIARSTACGTTPDDAGPAPERFVHDTPYRHLMVSAALHGDAPFDAAAFVRQLLPKLPPGAAVHDYSAYGLTTLFCWSMRPLPEPSVCGASPAWPAVCTGWVEAGAFPDVWYRLLAHVDRLWYRGRAGIYRLAPHTCPSFPHAPAFWKREIELYQALEDRQAETAVRLIRDLWSEMEQRRTPMVTVKETSLRLARFLHVPEVPELKTLAERILQSGGHEELFAVMADAIKRYLRTGPAVAAKMTDHPDINKIIRYIHAHYDENITLKSMSRLVAMDENYLSGLFGKKTGEPLIRYVQRTRVEAAKHFLLHTSLSVNEIGEKVGFVHPNYFFKVFKRWTRTTPSEFRKQNESGRQN